MPVEPLIDLIAHALGDTAEVLGEDQSLGGHTPPTKLAVACLILLTLVSSGGAGWLAGHFWGIGPGIVAGVVMAGGVVGLGCWLFDRWGWFD